MVGQVSLFKYEHEDRLILGGCVVNPRNETGKMGVRLHDCVTRLFYSTVKISARTKGETELHNFYVNRRSAIRWINAQTDDTQQLKMNADETTVLRKIEEIAAVHIDWSAPINKRLHEKCNYSERPLHHFVDRIKGAFWNLFWSITTFKWQLFMLRFSVLTSETGLQRASEARANAIFWKGFSRVPAYKDHVARNGGVPKTFSAVPITDKPSYIKYHDAQHDNASEMARTMVDGRFPVKGQCDTSTGTTGKPTMWIRGNKERKMVKTLIHYATRVVVGQKPILFINAFALGPWATGMTVSNALFERAITFSTGPDIEKILDVLNQFPKNKYPDHQYVIAGYPPFMNDLVKEAQKQGLDLAQYNIVAVVGGEPIADGIRESVLQAGFTDVLSSYGASDLDINIGYESKFEQELRKACKDNPEFAAELYGSNEPVPSIFHYDPLNYYIETNAEQELIFTCVRDDRVSPRIRYNLHDRGKVMRVQDVMAVAQKYGVEIPVPRTNLPLVFVWGREGTANFRGAKVPIGHLQDAVAEVLPSQVQNLAFREHETDHGTELSIMLELNEVVTKTDQEKTDLASNLLECLKTKNQDFKYQMERLPNPADSPKVEWYLYGQSPMSHQDPHRKKKYVYNDKDMAAWTLAKSSH